MSTSVKRHSVKLHPEADGMDLAPRIRRLQQFSIQAVPHHIGRGLRAPTVILWSTVICKFDSLSVDIDSCLTQ